MGIEIEKSLIELQERTKAVLKEYALAIIARDTKGMWQPTLEEADTLSDSLLAAVLDELIQETGEWDVRRDLDK